METTKQESVALKVEIKDSHRLCKKAYDTIYTHVATLHTYILQCQYLVMMETFAWRILLIHTLLMGAISMEVE